MTKFDLLKKRGYNLSIAIGTMKEIPKSAKKVFQGIIFDVYQWRQKMFDGSSSVFEVAKRQDTVVILATIGNKIIVLHQRQPTHPWFYALPSGRMDVPGEKPKSAAVRELLEETGYRPNKIRLWKKVSSDGKVLHSTYFYIASGCQRVSELHLDSGEDIEVGLYSFNEFLELSDHPRCFFGPLMIDVLHARIHERKRRLLQESIFKKDK